MKPLSDYLKLADRYSNRPLAPNSWGTGSEAPQNWGVGG